MNYEQARLKMKEAQKYGSVLGLDNMKEMMELLGNPQDALSFVHIAGTNGKGSVGAFLKSILDSAGYRAGRFTSPPVFDVLESWEAGNRRISPEEYADCASLVFKAAERMERAGHAHPTVFEMETALAFVWFAQRKCDLVLLETGMGGDLDATNIVKTTILAVLTPISLDHTAYLGSTLHEIAQKKAGIIKPGCMCVSGVQEQEAAEVIRKKCRTLNVPLTETLAEEAELTASGLHGLSFRYRGREWRTTLAGSFQLQNALEALKAAELLDRAGFSVSAGQMKEGLEAACWPGRFTVLDGHPLLVMDGAHNPAAADALAENIGEFFGEGRLKGKLVYIIGMFKDKDFHGVLQRTAPYADSIFTVQTPDSSRALPAGQLAEAAEKYCPQVRACPDLETAFGNAAEAAGREGAVIAFGSLSFLGRLAELAGRMPDTVREDRQDKGVMEEQPGADLLECRAQIDRIDSEIVRLFEQRMRVSEAVASYKIRTGMQVLDSVREAQKIAQVTDKAHGSFNRQGTRELFSQIMAISRKKQYQMLTEHGNIWESGFAIVPRLELSGVSVVFQGVEGAYSYAAMREYFGEDITSRHVKTWRDAMEAVSTHEADYAVLPIENSTAGIVTDIYDLLMQYRLYIVGEQTISVNHVLLGLPAAQENGIREVYSHPQGLAQCRDYLETHPEWKTMKAENTAGAAKWVSEKKDPSVAAIASREAGRLYGLKVLQEDICSNPDNETRFIILGSGPVCVKDARTISICFEIAHTTGSLYNMLSHIIYNGLNMTKIESRPIPGKNWEYRFFVDFSGGIADSSVVNALRGIEAEASMLRILGNY